MRLDVEAVRVASKVHETLERPPYRFARNAPPPALRDYRNNPRWVAWGYVLKDGKWAKIPFDPKTGEWARVNEPSTWGTFDEAIALLKRRRDLAGISIMMVPEDDLFGIDLDDCVTDSGSFSPLAAELLQLSETYAEISPSGEGVRMFARGAARRAIKLPHVKVYYTDRHLTVTGDHVDGTPHLVGEAPQTLARLQQEVDARKPAKTGMSGKKATGDDFFGAVNALALAHLDAWVPTLHPSAGKHGTGAWRVTSKALGRQLEEDLAYHPEGIRDHGEEVGLTAIDAVRRYSTVGDAVAAGMWLCQRLGVEPTSIGWRGKPAKQDGSNAGTEWKAPDMSIIRRNRVKAPPFPLDVLGSAASWVEIVAASRSAPVDYVALDLLVVAAGVIGAKRRASPWPGWEEPSILWGVSVGEPSANKSPSRPFPRCRASRRGCVQSQLWRSSS
jgi:hypothetical protein